jgi:hypothetical protein
MSKSRICSVLIYVEFGASFPFNGGELIYVCFSHLLGG